MKRIIFLFSGIIFSVFTFANPSDKNSENVSDSGIAFHVGTWTEALELAEKEGKPIFLDVSASWCGACKKLKTKSFPDSEVASFYNANFVNVVVDGEKGEGIELAEKYKVKKYPNLIFIDSKGKVIAQTAGYQSPKKLIEIGKQIIQ